MPSPNLVPTFQVRTATIRDIDGLTTLHCSSFGPQDHIPVILGVDYVRATYRWLTTSSQAYCLVADLDQKIIGLVTVCDCSFTRPMFLACLPEFMQSLLHSPRLIFATRLWERLLRGSHACKEAKHIVARAGFAQLNVVAVDTKWRGTGIFQALVEAAKTCSKSRGSLAIRAGVYKCNQASRKAFAKSGWIETPQLETADTVCYVAYLDPEFPKRLGIVLQAICPN